MCRDRSSSRHEITLPSGRQARRRCASGCPPAACGAEPETPCEAFCTVNGALRGETERRRHGRIRPQHDGNAWPLRHRAPDVPGKRLSADPLRTDHAAGRLPVGDRADVAGHGDPRRHGRVAPRRHPLVLCRPLRRRAPAEALHRAPWPLADHGPGGCRRGRSLVPQIRHCRRAVRTPGAGGAHADLGAGRHREDVLPHLPGLLRHRQRRLDDASGQNYEAVESYVGPVSNAVLIAIVGFYIYRVATFDRSHTRAETTDDSPR